MAQIQEYNQNIIVVATKLQKQKHDTFKDNWKESEDFKNIEKALKNKVGEGIPILPLKFSKAFDNIFEEQKSIKQLMENNPLARFNYREVNKQFDELYNLIGISSWAKKILIAFKSKTKRFCLIHHRKRF